MNEKEGDSKNKRGDVLIERYLNDPNLTETERL